MNMVIVTPLLAVESDPKAGLFLSYSSSKKLVTDLRYYGENYPKLEQKYAICSEQYSNERKINTTNTQLLDGCNKDKADLKVVKKEFEDKFSKASAEVDDCMKSKPSRLTWFGIGSVTTLIAILVTVFTVRK